MIAPGPSRLPQQRAGDTAVTWLLAIAQLVSWGSVYYSFALLILPMEHAMGWPRAQSNAALSLGLLVSAVAAYPVGAWIDRGYGKRIMVAGSALSAAMLLLWANAQSVVVLFVVWTGLGVSMAATLYDPVFAVVTHDYPQTFRSKITLITLVGGFAGTLFIPSTQGLVDWLGWRGALVVLAAANLLICMPLHAIALKPLQAEKIAPDSPSRTPPIKDEASVRRALHSETFWALAVCFATYYATFVALTFHLVPLLTERHVSKPVILTTMAIIGPAQVLARLLWFTVARNARPRVVGLLVTTMLPLSVVILICAKDLPALLFLFALIYGGANGMMTILRGTVIQDVMWTEGYGAMSGLASVPSNLAKALAPIMAASIWGVWHTYGPVEWTVLGVSLMSAASFVVARYTSRDVG